MAVHQNISGLPINREEAGSSSRVMKGAFPKIPARIVIFSKDVENITGLSQRASRRLLQTIKEGLGKSNTMFVTVNEFCICTGIPEEEVKDFLK